MENLFGCEGILVEEEAKGGVKFWELAFEGSGAFEKSLDADGPEFLVVGGGVVA